MKARMLLETVRIGYAPQTQLTVSEFCDREIIVTTGPLEGSHWQTSFTPYLKGILNVFHEPGVEIAVVQASSQVGKTSAAIGIVAYHIVHVPTRIMVVEPTVDPMAKDFATNRLDPVIAASPALRERVSTKRARGATNTTLSKTYRGGDLAISGANSAASLAARSRRLLILDEVDRYPEDLKGEGNPIAIALKRTQSYGRRRRVLIISSPTIVGRPIDVWFHRGDQRRYHVPCPGPMCRFMHPLEWKNVRFENRDPSTARLVCPQCSYAFGDAQRLAILPHGDWVPGNPERRDKRIVSFHIWEAYSPMSSLREIVEAFLSARDAQKRGDNSDMETWQNTTLAEARDPDAGRGVEPLSLMVRRERFAAELPAGVYCLTIGVDTQDDRLEALLVGWAPGEESWILGRETLPGDPATSAPWELLDLLISRRFQHERGITLPVHQVCIDSAGHKTSFVYSYVRSRQPRVLATIGRTTIGADLISPSKTLQTPQGPIHLRKVDTDQAKAAFFARVVLTEPGRGFVHLGDGVDEETVEQLTSEILVTRFEKGIAKQYWKQTRPRNESLDCFCLAHAALRIVMQHDRRWPTWCAGVDEAIREAAAAAPADDSAQSGGAAPARSVSPAPTPSTPEPGRQLRRSRSSYLDRNRGSL